MYVSDIRDHLQRIPEKFLQQLPLLIVNNKSYNRFLSENGRLVTEMWNAWLILYNLQPTLDPILLAKTLWKIWYPPNQIYKLNKAEKDFIIQSCQIKLTERKFYWLVDAKTALPNGEIVFFFDLYDLIEIIISMYYLQLPALKVVWLRTHETFLLNLSKYDLSWLNSFPFDVGSSHIPELNTGKQGLSLPRLCLGFPKRGSYSYQWWILELWFQGVNTPLPELDDVLNKSGLRREVVSICHA